jgi:hypothetical protein
MNFVNWVLTVPPPINKKTVCADMLVVVEKLELINNKSVSGLINDMHVNILFGQFRSLNEVYVSLTRAPETDTVYTDLVNRFKTVRYHINVRSGTFPDNERSLLDDFH